MAEPSTPVIGPIFTNESSPWWAKVLDRWGFPTAVAALLLWFFLTQGGAALADFNKAQGAMNTALTAHSAQMKMDAMEMRFYLRQLCVNSARTEAARSLCLQGPVQ